MITWLKKKWCAKFGHDYESNSVGAIVCTRCGHVLAESRSEFLRSLLPEIQKIFGVEYAKYTKEKS
jgi:hypothetical protein